MPVILTGMSITTTKSDPANLESQLAKPAGERLDFGELGHPKEQTAKPLDFGDLEIPAADLKDWGTI